MEYLSIFTEGFLGFLDFCLFFEYPLMSFFWSFFFCFPFGLHIAGSLFGVYSPLVRRRWLILFLLSLGGAVFFFLFFFPPFFSFGGFYFLEKWLSNREVCAHSAFKLPLQRSVW